MANLVHRPLDDLKIAAQVVAGGDGDVDVTMTQLAPTSMLNLRLNPDNSDVLDAAQAALGQALPRQASQRSDDGKLWWLGPDEWMLNGLSTATHQRLAEALADKHHSLVDVSHQFEGFEVSGPMSRDLLAHVVTLDLHPRVLQKNACVQTVAAHCNIMLLVDQSGERFQIFTRRSFVTYIWSRLVDAAADMDLAIAPA